jgi:hypothetical protein
VHAGGSLVAWAGDQAAPSLQSLAAAGLLPGGEVASPINGSFRAAKWDRSHPALQLFADPQYGDLRRIEFRTLLPLSSLSAEARGLIEAGGLPLVVELPVGPAGTAGQAGADGQRQPVPQGRVLYLATSADRDWKAIVWLLLAVLAFELLLSARVHA